MEMVKDKLKNRKFLKIF